MPLKYPVVESICSGLEFTSFSDIFPGIHVDAETDRFSVAY